MMNDLLTKINILSKNNNDNAVYDLVEEQLKHEANDIKLWLSLAIVIVEVPIVDYEKSIACIKKALDIDKDNVIALLILAYVYEHELGGIDDILLNKIESLHTDSAELNSMLKYVASWSYARHKKNDFLKEEILLKESINLYGGHVWNYKNLARLYLAQGRKSEAYFLIKKALSNIKIVYGKENYEYEPTDINEFINERLKGIHLTDSNVRLIQKMLNFEEA